MNSDRQPLEDGSEENDGHIGAEQQMKEMMGFASFGSAVKRQRMDSGDQFTSRLTNLDAESANSPFSPPQPATEPTSDPPSAQSHLSFVPASLPPRPPQNLTSTTSSQFTTHQDNHTQLSETRHDGERVAYTNADTGISFTVRELREWANGKQETLPDGSTRMVYFKPSFVDDDPWARNARGR